MIYKLLGLKESIEIQFKMISWYQKMLHKKYGILNKI